MPKKTHTIDITTAASIMEAVGYATAPKWNPDRLRKAVNKFKLEVGQPVPSEAVATILNMRADGYTIEVTAAEAPQKPQKAKAVSKAKKKAKAPQKPPQGPETAKEKPKRKREKQDRTLAPAEFMLPICTTGMGKDWVGNKIGTKAAALNAALLEATEENPKTQMELRNASGRADTVYVQLNNYIRYGWVGRTKDGRYYVSEQARKAIKEAAK